MLNAIGNQQWLKSLIASFSSAMKGMALKINQQLACIIFFKTKCRTKSHHTSEALALEKNVIALTKTAKQSNQLIDKNTPRLFLFF
jgi:hypothetical protein